MQALPAAVAQNARNTAMKRPCAFCGGEVIKGKCIRCGTTYPTGAKRGHRTDKAYEATVQHPYETGGGSWDDVIRAHEGNDQ